MTEAELKEKLDIAVEALTRIQSSQPRPKKNGDYDSHAVSSLRLCAKNALDKIKVKP